MYLNAIRASLNGYRALLWLLLGLFRICADNNVFRDQVSAIFQEKEGKKILKDVKSWVKDVSTNFASNIRYDKMGYWRRPRDLKMSYQTLNYLLENEDKINVDKFQTALNAIVERHNTFQGTGLGPLEKDDLVKHT